MRSFYRLLRPLLFALDPETAHRMAILALRSGLLGHGSPPDPPELATRIMGLEFPNPVGIAAGFDKNAQVPDALLKCGFGFAEIGTVTPRAQAGNARPRLFRLRNDRAVINRLGFNNHGLVRIKARLEARRVSGRPGIVGANVGANKDQVDRPGDFARGVAELAGLADYLVINISSPNTPGLRDLQEKAALDKLLDRVLAAREQAGKEAGRTPVLVKIAPDLDPETRRDIARTVLDHRIDGMIVSNTMIARPENLHSRRRDQQGGLSGRPLFEPSTRLLAEMYRLTEGRMPLIGVGGVSSGDDAYDKIQAGASLVQLYSALVYDGLCLVDRIKYDLAGRLRADGFATVADAVGTRCDAW
ncbi:MAG: quinone-dependent dihydroorotate dehydrogenase [Sphingomonadales bacterium]